MINFPTIPIMSAGSELVKFLFKTFLGVFPGNLLDRFALKMKLKGAAKEAIGEFKKLFKKELSDHNISDADIARLYSPALNEFIKDKEVRAFLGQAFTPVFKEFEGDIERIWFQRYLPSEVAFPADFNWDLLLKKYQDKAKKIKRNDDKLRNILDSETSEQLESHLKSLFLLQTLQAFMVRCYSLGWSTYYIRSSYDSSRVNGTF